VKSLIAWILWLLGELLMNLVTNLLGDWLMRRIARWIVRYQASAMGEQSARCREEWLAHLDETPDGWTQLKVALRMLEVPFNTFIEKCCDVGAGRATVAWIREHGALVTSVPVAVLLFKDYPLDQTRFAAYAVAIPLLLLCVLSLTPLFRRALAIGYERLNYGSRIVMGGLAVPVVVYLIIAWGWVPPSERPPKRAVKGALAATRPPLVVIPSLPLDIDIREAIEGQEQSKDPASTRVSPSSDFLSARESLQNNSGLLGNRTLPILLLSEIPGIPIPNLPNEDGLVSARTLLDLSMSDLPEIHLPKQPLPATEEEVRMLAPAAPTNLRIVAAN
jgi:hypothetical protein